MVTLVFGDGVRGSGSISGNGVGVSGGVGTVARSGSSG